MLIFADGATPRRPHTRSALGTTAYAHIISHTLRRSPTPLSCYGLALAPKTENKPLLHGSITLVADRLPLEGSIFADFGTYRGDKPADRYP
jgi:hypothetical protein